MLLTSEQRAISAKLGEDPASVCRCGVVCTRVCMCGAVCVHTCACAGRGTGTGTYLGGHPCCEKEGAARREHLKDRSSGVRWALRPTGPDAGGRVS